MKFASCALIAPLALVLTLAPVQVFAGDEEAATASEETQAASETAEGQTQTASVSEKDPNEIICKTKKITGSRLRAKKICKTREEWNNTFNAFRAVNDMQDGATANSERQ